MRKILIIRQLPAGWLAWRGAAARKPPRSAAAAACPGSSGQRSPGGSGGRAGCRRAPSCRAAAPGPRPAPPQQPARGGLPTHGENLIFGIWPLLSAIRRPLKMKREVAAAWRACHSTERRGCCRPGLGVTRSAQPRGWDIQCHPPLPRAPLRGHTSGFTLLRSPLF